MNVQCFSLSQPRYLFQLNSKDQFILKFHWFRYVYWICNNKIHIHHLFFVIIFFLLWVCVFIVSNTSQIEHIFNLHRKNTVHFHVNTVYVCIHCCLVSKTVNHTAEWWTRTKKKLQTFVNKNKQTAYSNRHARIFCVCTLFLVQIQMCYIIFVLNYVAVFTDMYTHSLFLSLSFAFLLAMCLFFVSLSSIFLAIFNHALHREYKNNFFWKKSAILW